MLCVLLLRGAQTPGEIRGRAERLHHFEELDEVEMALGKLMKREPSMVAVLPRQPGTKESRYLELMSGEAGAPLRSRSVASLRAFRQHVENAAPAAEGSGGRRVARRWREGRRRERTAGAWRGWKRKWRNCAGKIAALQAQFAEFRKQFE